jgi:hypothetical protein
MIVLPVISVQGRLRAAGTVTVRAQAQEVDLRRLKVLLWVSCA